MGCSAAALLGLGCVCACLAACAGGGVRFVGPSPSCAAGFGERAILVRTGTTFAFAPADGAIVVHGATGPDGRFTGTLALRPTDSKSKPLVLSVFGTTDATGASVEYEAGQCRASLRLARVGGG